MTLPMPKKKGRPAKPKPVVNIEEDESTALNDKETPAIDDQRDYESNLDYPEIDEPRKVMPESELELNYFFTNPQWGDDTVNSELQDSLKKAKIQKIPKGQVYKDDKGNTFVSDGNVEAARLRNYWSNLSYLTRDIRLANYDQKTYNYCAYYYELGGAMLNEEYPEAASICIQMAAIHGEMSQGIKGFLRQMQQTLIKKEEHTTQERKDSILNRRQKNTGEF